MKAPIITLTEIKMIYPDVHLEDLQIYEGNPEGAHLVGAHLENTSITVTNKLSNAHAGVPGFIYGGSFTHCIIVVEGADVIFNNVSFEHQTIIQVEPKCSLIFEDCAFVGLQLESQRRNQVFFKECGGEIKIKEHYQKICNTKTPQLLFMPPGCAPYLEDIHRDRLCGMVENKFEAGKIATALALSRMRTKSDQNLQFYEDRICSLMQKKRTRKPIDLWSVGL